MNITLTLSKSGNLQRVIGACVNYSVFQPCVLDWEIIRNRLVDITIKDVKEHSEGLLKTVLQQCSAMTGQYFRRDKETQHGGLVNCLCWKNTEFRLLII